MKIAYYLLLLPMSIGLPACANESGIKCMPTSNYQRVSLLSVVPEHVSKGDSFKVMFSKTDFDHPANFAITNSNGEYFVVLDDSVTVGAMSSKEFAACQVLEINTSSLKGVFWDEDGNQNTKNIFHKQGTYSLYFADELETESSNTFSLSINIQLVD